MDPAFDEQGANWGFIIKRYRTGRKEEAEQLPNAPMPNEVKTAEFDEIFTYIGDKKTGST